MSSPATDPSITSWSRSPKRLHQIDPGLALADMFDPVITRKLWDSLPEECRRDHFDKKTMPTHYRPAIREVNAGGPWTACYLNFRDLPEPMTWEIAWIIHRYIELGQFVHVVENLSAHAVTSRTRSDASTDAVDAATARVPAVMPMNRKGSAGSGSGTP